MSIERLRRFVADLTSLVGGAWQDRDEAAIVEVGRTLLAELVARDDWLPDWLAQCPPQGYAANLLWCDPFERFSVVSLVWAPGARTPVHDHQVWGLVGILRGCETSQRFVRDVATGAIAPGNCSTLSPGEIEVLSPAEGDIHQVANARADGSSLSIHVYGGNIGAMRRQRFDPASGAASPFVSGYANRQMPNLWDRPSSIGQVGVEM
jgi:predicted metal-dependent enzyme (double-stranded beta helix superfamily)